MIKTLDGDKQMIAVLIGLVILMILVLVAVRSSFTKEVEEPEPESPPICVSGIWSVIRNSPKEALMKIRPREEEIRKYLASQNEDIGKLLLRDSDRKFLLEHWNTRMEASVKEIEAGDKEGAEFYYYDFPQDCPGCQPYISKGQFVSREEIYRYPRIIPPFHLGCSCSIKAHHGDENLRETTESGLRPFFTEGTIPPLPEWTTTVLISQTAEAGN